MKYREYCDFVKSDLYRYSGQKTCRAFVKCLIFVPGFKYTFLMRTTRYLSRRRYILIVLYILSRWALQHLQIKYGINIPYDAVVGAGLYIGHYGGIVVNHEVRIGSNCNINHEVTIGVTYGGKHPGAPVIGDYVYLGPGSKVIGGIKVGNHVAIGANCVVTMDIPENAVVVGNPGKISSHKGSSNYVVNTDW